MKNIFLLIITLMISFCVKAEDEGILNRLFAPGPLIVGHKDLEGKECLKCHESGKGVVDSKCLDCHKDIKKFVEDGLGFHGRMSESCVKCHGDHKGRDFDSTEFDHKTFDHFKTGYKLEGKHHEIKCEECHTPKRGNKRVRPNDVKFLGITSSCRACHKKEDIHFYIGEYFKKDCSACHGLAKWTQEIKFDHNKDTKFKLNGIHDGLECQDCHNPNKDDLAKSVYKWPKLQKEKCLSCHQNFHKNNLSPKFQGGDCSKCHGEVTWKIPTFAHKITGYTLRGKHEELKCEECHKDAKNVKHIASQSQPANIKWVGLKKDCLSCHKDEHRYGKYKSPTKLNPNNCLNCHNEKAWDQIHDFNHTANTRFKIDGEHRELQCSECHLEVAGIEIPKPKPGIYFWQNLTTKTCENCHKSPHTKEFSKKMLLQRCTDCHVTEGWNVVKAGKNFNHDNTRFQLTGKHQKVSCTECHVKNKKQVFKWESRDRAFCIECHENVHKKQFSEKFNTQSCSECHDSQSFTKRKTFDHGLTSFALKGAHSKVECKECHTPTPDIFPVKPPHYMSQYKFPNLPTEKCLTCHADVHNKQLGKDCLRCHNETKWSKMDFDHNKQTRYPLLFKHEDVDCKKCHKPTNEVVIENKKEVKVILYKPINNQCGVCHKDSHHGHFGQQCSSCHTEKAWKATSDFHKDFSLTGVHLNAQCSECHMQNRKLGGLSQECIYCHKKDDVHSGTLPNCRTCHLQMYWEDTKFRHSLTGFPLKGAHRTLQCQDCHFNGTYQGLTSDCYSCHKATLNGATSPVNHSPQANFTNCIQCHHGNPFKW